jgi:hypothetical protein
MTRVGRSGGAIGWGVGILILNLAVLPHGILASQDVVILDFRQGEDGIPPGWQVATKEGAADVALVREDQAPALRLRSHASSFSLQREVDIDLRRTPYLVWEWKVTALPKFGDVRNNRMDDQAAQLFVLFSPDFLRTDVIAYVWDSTAPAGTVVELPVVPIYPALRIKVLVVRSGDARRGQWMTETRNVADDYKNLFKGDPDRVTGMRIQINSQHTKSQAESYWRYLIFTTRP